MTHEHPPEASTAETSPAALQNLTTTARMEGHSLARLMKPRDPSALPEHMADALRASLEIDADCETLLAMQTQVLHALFHRLLDKGVGAINIHGQYIANYTDSEYIALALTAQKQCRAAADALSKIRTRKAFCPPPSKNDEQTR